MGKDFVWQGTQTVDTPKIMEPFSFPCSIKAGWMKLKRPCECGCDFRDGTHGVGYLIGSDGSGSGFTIWVETEEVYQMVYVVLQQLRGATPALEAEE